MTGETKKVIEWTPADITLSGMTDQPVSGEFKIKASEGVEVELTALKGQKKVVTVDELTEITPHKEWSVKISAMCESGAKKETLNADVKVLSANGARDVKVPISVNVKGLRRIEVTPPDTLSFNKRDTAGLKGADAKPITKELTISGSGPDIQFHVTGFKIVDMPEGLCEAELKEVKPGNQYKLAVTLKQAIASRFARGKLIIETDDPTRPKIEVKLFAHFEVAEAAAAPAK